MRLKMLLSKQQLQLPWQPALKLTEAYENQAVVSVTKGVKLGFIKQTVFLVFH